MSFCQLEFKNFEHFFKHLFEFVEFHEIGYFQSYMKNRYCVWSKNPRLKMQTDVTIYKSHPARCVKALIDFKDKRKRRKTQPEHKPNKTCENAIFT